MRRIKGMVLWLGLLTVPSFPQITVKDTLDEGQAAWKITTPAATYFFQKAAGGFSSLIDADGNDWISFNRSSGAAGMYRGIPNLVHPGDIFHPGHAHCKSSLNFSSQLAMITTSDSLDKWACRWEIFPTHATLTVTKMDRAFWFLYEGTPGGAFHQDRDYWMISTGTREACSQVQGGDIPSPEWICFGDTSMTRVLFLLHHEDDQEIDRYYEMDPMTVFGFGRSGLNKYLDQVPTTVSIGLLEDSSYAAVSAAVTQVLDGPAIRPAHQTFIRAVGFPRRSPSKGEWNVLGRQTTVVGRPLVRISRGKREFCLKR